MADSNKILLVEGKADASFFKALCKQQSLSATVKVAPPKEVGGTHNTKNGVFNLLTALLTGLPDTPDGRLGIVVDADQPEHGSGFEKTVQCMSVIATEFGYTLLPTDSTASGLIYTHDDGLADIGIWIMPDNASNGILENWLTECISADEKQLMLHVTSVLDQLPQPPKFKPLRRSKAEIATWLAWQEKPGEGLYTTIEADLLNTSAPLYTGLTTWLNRVFG